MSNNQLSTTKLSNNKLVKIMEFDSRNAVLEAAKFRLGLQKQKIGNSKNFYLNELNFNGLKPDIQLNEIQCKGYNKLRKFNSSFESTSKNTRNIFLNESNIKFNESILQSNESSVTSATKDLEQRSLLQNIPNVESYKAADGTTYKHLHSNNGITIETTFPSKNVIHVPGKYHELYRQWITNNDIPQNIRHKFGTKQTEYLLSNQIKVHDTLAKIHNTGIIKKNAEQFDKSILNLNEKDVLTNEYYDLGNHLRHSIAHGYPTIYHTGLKESIHNVDVNKKHMENWQKNVITPHRRKTDWLIKWTELNVVDERIIRDYALKEAERSEEKRAKAN
ncbi:unnamed protein product [Brachionus calyciflorus]|uniref:Uncharacterized protein n=1 Tax=Brachionus calyciflorus TaxID=104777 RepID=A0A814K3T3_9BILA|nr:unnamed protein product [Brachionus calyciflorus]